MSDFVIFLRKIAFHLLWTVICNIHVLFKAQNSNSIPVLSSCKTHYGASNICVVMLWLWSVFFYFFYSGGDGGSVDSSSSLNSLRKLHILSLESASQPRFNIHGILRDCIKMFLVIKDIPGMALC